jgi:hypothetical protein
MEHTQDIPSFLRRWTAGKRWLERIRNTREKVLAPSVEMIEYERETVRLKRLLHETERRVRALEEIREKLIAENELLRQKAARADELERQISELKRRQARIDKRRLEENRLTQFEAAVRRDVGKSPEVFCDRTLEEFARTLPVLFGLFYVRRIYEEDRPFVALGSYARAISERVAQHFYLGEGVAGEVARTSAPRYMPLDSLPQKPTVTSALARLPAQALLFLPIGNENETLALVELALARKINHDELFFAEKAAKSLSGIVEGIVARALR